MRVPSLSFLLEIRRSLGATSIASGAAINYICQNNHIFFRTYQVKMHSTTSTVVPEESIVNVLGSNHIHKTLNQNPTAAVLRYIPGDDRFQFTFTLTNGKIFNFDRSVAETLATFKERIGNNVSKKLKKFDGNIKLLVSTETREEEYIETILHKVVEGSESLNLQIGEDTFEVEINPPEIFRIKFLKIAMADFPVFPLKWEFTANFQLGLSKFKWEFSKEIRPKPVPERLKKKKSLTRVDTQVTESESVPSWQDCNFPHLIFFPSLSMKGGFLRFTCTPSDGYRFGLPFSSEIPVSNNFPPVTDFIYLERLSRMEKAQKDGNFIRVISYNALADTYATPEWFNSSPPDSLSIDYRLPILNKELLSYEGDIICMQEVDDKLYEGNFQPFFAHTCNFQGVFSSKIGDTKEGVATFYNPEKFCLLGSETIVILNHLRKLPMWKSVLSRHVALAARLEDRNTVLQVSVFELKGVPDYLLLVANTHLYFHPDADHIRLIQTITCIDYIKTKYEEVKSNNPSKKVTILFCGDFNCTPPFSSFRLLMTGKITEDDEDWICHETEKLIPGIQFEHDLTLSNSHPEEPLTNITASFEGCLDYILYQKEHLTLLKTYPPPDKAKLASLIGVEIEKVSLPNFHVASDHLPLIADFLIPKKV